MGPVVGLPATMHISPEESQIKEFATTKLPGGSEAELVAGLGWAARMIEQSQLIPIAGPFLWPSCPRARSS